jgi:hypothetical protein
VNTVFKGERGCIFKDFTRSMGTLPIAECRMRIAEDEIGEPEMERRGDIADFGMRRTELGMRNGKSQFKDKKRQGDAGTPTRGDTVTGKHPKFRIAPAFVPQSGTSRRQGVQIAESEAKCTRRVGLRNPGAFLQFLDRWSGIYHRHDCPSRFNSGKFNKFRLITNLKNPAHYLLLLSFH